MSDAWLEMKRGTMPFLMKEGVYMDGYVITNDHDTAIAAFDDESVRHSAALDNGQGLVAYEGDHLPCAGRLFLNDPDQFGFWDKVRRVGPSAKVRRVGPQAMHAKVRRYGPQFSDEPETFVLMTKDHFLALNPISVRMASVLIDGTILAITLPDSVPPESALWTASAEWFLDKRLALIDA